MSLLFFWKSSSSGTAPSNGFYPSPVLASIIKRVPIVADMIRSMPSATLLNSTVSLTSVSEYGILGDTTLTYNETGHTYNEIGDIYGGSDRSHARGPSLNMINLVPQGA